MVDHRQMMGSVDSQQQNYLGMGPSGSAYNNLASGTALGMII